MTITGNLRVKQPFLGIEVAPNNDFRFWEEKENLQGVSGKVCKGSILGWSSLSLLFL